jgi:hypothetical protein
MKVVNKTADNWDDLLDPILFAYRTNKQASTKLTPFELMYGVKAKLPTDLEREGDASADPEDDVEARRQRIVDLGEAMVEQRNRALENIAGAQAKQKQRYDIKHQRSSYNIGDKVLKSSSASNSAEVLLVIRMLHAMQGQIDQKGQR